MPILFYIGVIKMKNFFSFAISLLVLLSLSNANAAEFLEIRSSEIEVIEKCHGEKIIGEVDGSDFLDTTEPCDVILDNIVPINVEVRSIELNGNKYTFALKPYYITGVALYSSEDSYMLLTGKYGDFLNSVVVNIRVYKKGELDEEATERARANARNKFETFVSNVQAEYNLTEVYYKKVFMRSDLLEDVDNKVFAINKENELIGVKTDKDNNVFRATNGECIEEVKSDEKIYNKEDYFYLCGEDSICGDCGSANRVAYGTWCGQKYFSKYCKEHACLFVWEHETDSTNEIASEGLKCIHKTVNGSFCGTHKCRYEDCANGIVGLSAVGEPFDDIRLTGNGYLKNYSPYCTNHKCKAVMCTNQRFSQDITADKSNGKVISPLYCSVHSSGCMYMIGSTPCGEAVDEKSYNKDFKMLCSIHRSWEFKLEEYSKNNLCPRLTRCSCCGQVKAVYQYTTDEDKNTIKTALCTSCLRADWINELMNDVDIAFALIELMKHDSINSIKEDLPNDNYAIFGDIYIEDAEGNQVLFDKAIDLRMVRGQANGFVKPGDYVGGIGGKYAKDGSNDYVVMANCVNGGMNPLARVFSKYGLSLYDSSGKNNLLEISGKWSFKETDSEGNYTGTEFNLSTLKNLSSCSTWYHLATPDSSSDKTIISPLVSEVRLGKEGDKRRKDFVNTHSPTEFVNFLGDVVAINSGFTGSTYHTRYPVQDVSFTDPTTGEQVSATLIHNVSTGDGDKALSKIPREDAYFAKIVKDENGNDQEQLVKVLLSKNANGEYYISPNLCDELDEVVEDDGCTYGYENNQKKYKVVDGVRYEVDSNGNFVYSVAYQETTVEEVVSNITDFFFFNGDIDIMN